MTDWIASETPQALEVILERVAVHRGSKKKRWTRFERRLERRFPELFRLAHGLYGWRYDFAWWLERLVDVAAEAAMERPRGLLVDQEETTEDGWLGSPATVWAMTYVDRFSGTLDALPDHIDYLADLGISHLHLMPPYARAAGGGDGGYAVTDYRRVHPSLGSMNDLRKAIRALNEHSIGVVLDFVANHTADDHPWAEAAKRGDARHQARYLMYDDRTVPDRFATNLRSIFPEREGDGFIWRTDVAGPTGGKWVWTTFFESQWDLDYRNPDVLVAMATELLFVVNLGASVVRMDATPFLWKEEGTSCENLPQAHQVLQIFNILVELVAPSVALLSEAIVHPDDVSRFVRPDECRIGYNPVIMSTIWEALATRDTRLLRSSLAHRQRLPEGCQWLTYLRSHDDIGWGFADEDAEALGVDPQLHRLFLNDFYTGGFPGSWARGLRFQENPNTGDARISGTLAALAGLESALESADSALVERAVDRILAAYAVMAFSSGVPLLFLGDEMGQLNDHGYAHDPVTASDNRWTHRPPFDWERLSRLEGEGGGAGRLLSEVRRMISLRPKIEGLRGRSGSPTAQPDKAVIGFVRSHGDAAVEVVVNLSDRPAEGSLGMSGRDVWGDRDVDPGPLALAPYEVLVVVGEGATTRPPGRNRVWS